MFNVLTSFCAAPPAPALGSHGQVCGLASWPPGLSAKPVQASGVYLDRKCVALDSTSHGCSSHQFGSIARLLAPCPTTFAGQENLAQVGFLFLSRLSFLFRK